MGFEGMNYWQKKAVSARIHGRKPLSASSAFSDHSGRKDGFQPKAKAPRKKRRSRSFQNSLKETISLVDDWTKIGEQLVNIKCSL